MVLVLLPPEEAYFLRCQQSSFRDQFRSGVLLGTWHHNQEVPPFRGSKSLPPRHSWPPICPPPGLGRGGTPQGSLNCGNSEIMYVKYLVRKVTYSKHSVNINYDYYHIPQR